MGSPGSGLVIGRYTLAEPIASGGMATIFLATQSGDAGFSRVVAIKRMHPRYVRDPNFISMFLDEARLAARIRHQNVVQTLDVVHEAEETLIVLEYIDGETVGRIAKTLVERGERVPMEVVGAIVVEACRGLHAAHEAKSFDGSPLLIVHRDVSPQNLIVGADGITRVTDFGIAHAQERLSKTLAGQVKGKPAYMAPEQITSRTVTRQSDLYSAGIILWELLAGRRAFDGLNPGALFARVASGAVPPLAEVAPWVPPPVVAVVARALAREPSERFASGREMAAALQAVLPIAPSNVVAAFVEEVAAEALASRRAQVLVIDRGAGEAVPKELPAMPSAAPPRLAASATAPPPATSPAPSTPSARRLEAPSPSSRDLSTQTLTAVPTRRRSGLVVLVVGVVLLLGGTALALALGFASRAKRASSPPPEARAVATATESPSVAKSAPEPAPAPLESVAAVVVVESTEPSASNAGSTTVAAGIRPVTSAPTTAAPGKTAASVRIEPSSAAPPPNPCDPPYYVDDQGIRRVKRNCF
ncbi:MAG: serine/threonine-protein kinase [Polyangiaceae bacterium]